jgi:hypothetical protein
MFLPNTATVVVSLIIIPFCSYYTQSETAIYSFFGEQWLKIKLSNGGNLWD